MSIKIDPKKEPFIRVGIILPEDQQKSITIYLGDFVSYYLALWNRADPSPVEIIEDMKKRLVE